LCLVLPVVAGACSTSLPPLLLLLLQMFMPTIMSQGDSEQQAKWLPPCLNLQVCGACTDAGLLTTILNCL
jgi:alkylation response protein AidB-like acyl-CoA dehydrogenase